MKYEVVCVCVPKMKGIVLRPPILLLSRRPWSLLFSPSISSPMFLFSHELQIFRWPHIYRDLVLISLALNSSSIHKLAVVTNTTCRPSLSHIRILQQCPTNGLFTVSIFAVRFYLYVNLRTQPCKI